MYLTKDVTTKVLLLASILFLSGCSTFDVITTAIQVSDVVAEPVKLKTTKKVEKPQLKNWNPPKTKPTEVVEKIEPIQKQTTSTPKEETITDFPWWLLFIAIISGTTYLINRYKT